jgi:hypothetical protein
MKRCKMCGEEKPLSEFYGNYKTKDGRLSWCKPCTVIRYREGVLRRAAAVRSYIQSIKMERGCTDCGYREHPEALEFDHLPGFVKEHRIAQLSAGAKREKIDAEIAKCEVVCANCHAVRTAKRRADAKGAQVEELDPLEGS